MQGQLCVLQFLGTSLQAPPPSSGIITQPSSQNFPQTCSDNKAPSLVSSPASAKPRTTDRQGLEIGVTLLGDFGATVCKFGADALKPVMSQTLDSLLKQTPEQLARLPQLAEAMAAIDPAVLSVSPSAMWPGFGACGFRACRIGLCRKGLQQLRCR